MPKNNFQEEIFENYGVKALKESVDLEIEKIIKNILNLRKFKHKPKILEVGCGGGQLLSSFVHDFDVYGVDISKKALNIAKKRGYNINRLDIENDNFPFEDDFFDIVIINDVLEHITNEDRLLRQIWRVLNKDGQFILAVPNISHPASWFMQIFLDLPPMQSSRYKSPHVRDHTLRLAKILLKLNGFKIRNIKGTFIYPFEGALSRYLSDAFPRFSERLIIISQKDRKPIASEKIIFNVWELVKRYEK